MIELRDLNTSNKEYLISSKTSLSPGKKGNLSSLTIKEQNYIFKKLLFMKLSQFGISIFFTLTYLFSYSVTSRALNIEKTNSFIYLFICCIIQIIICLSHIKIDKINLWSSINPNYIEHILAYSILNIIKFYLIIVSSSIFMPVEIGNITFSIPLIYQILLNERKFRKLEFILFSLNIFCLIYNYNILGIFGTSDVKSFAIIYPFTLASLYYWENKLNKKLNDNSHFYIITIISCIIGVSFLPLIAVIDKEVEVEISFNVFLLLICLTYSYFSLSYYIFNFDRSFTINSNYQLLTIPLLYMVNIITISTEIRIFSYIYTAFIFFIIILEKRLGEEYLSYDIDDEEEIN